MRDGKTLFEKEKIKNSKTYENSWSNWLKQLIKIGTEFGLGFENLSLIPKVCDRIICYDIKIVNDKIEWDIKF
jgi:hypothetical protein